MYNLVMPPTYPEQNNLYTPDATFSYSQKTKSFWRQRSTRIGIAIAFLVTVGLAITLFELRGSPQSVAKQFVSYITNQPASKSYQLTSTDFRAAISLATWQIDINSIKNTCSNKFTLTSSTKKALTARTLFSTSGANGNCHIEVDLINNSNKWLVDSFVSY